MRTLTRVGGMVLVIGVGVAIACEPQEKPVESGRGFATTVYNDTMVEHFSRTTKRLTGTLVTHTDTLLYTAMLGDSGLVTSVDVVVIAHRGHDRDTEKHHFAMPKGTLPIMMGSGAMFEQMLRRVRAVGGDSVSVPVMLVGAQPELNVFTVSSNGPDSLIAVPQNGAAEGNELRIAIDPSWRIMGAVLPISKTEMRALE